MWWAPTVVALSGLLVSCGSSEPETTTIDDSDTDEAIAISEAFMAAHRDLDAAAIQTVTAPDASILEFGFWRRTPDEYDGLFQWMEILDWDWDVDDCAATSEGPPIRVRCSFMTENDWSRSRDLDPVPGVFDLVLDDGSIVEVVLDMRPSWRDVPSHWVEWLEQNHPEEIAVLFRFDDEGNLTGGPATGPEAITLYRIRVPEYVAAQTAAEADAEG